MQRNEILDVFIQRAQVIVILTIDCVEKLTKDDTSPPKNPLILLPRITVPLSIYLQNLRCFVIS